MQGLRYPLPRKDPSVNGWQGGAVARHASGQRRPLGRCRLCSLSRRLTSAGRELEENPGPGGQPTLEWIRSCLLLRPEPGRPPRIEPLPAGRVTALLVLARPSAWATAVGLAVWWLCR
jgi:hypothetical protein